MAEKFETLGEAAVAFSNFKNDISTVWKVFGGIATAAVAVFLAVGGALIWQLIELNKTTALNTNALTNVVSRLDAIDQNNTAALAGLSSQIATQADAAFAELEAVRSDVTSVITTNANLAEDFGALQTSFQGWNPTDYFFAGSGGVGFAPGVSTEVLDLNDLGLGAGAAWSPQSPGVQALVSAFDLPQQGLTSDEFFRALEEAGARVVVPTDQNVVVDR